MTNIELFNEQMNRDYVAFIKDKFTKAESVKTVMENLSIKYNDKKLITKEGERGKDYCDYINAMCDFKYINRVDKDSKKRKIYYLDAQKLDEIFTKIETDERVVFFDKLTMLFLIDIFYDFRIKFSEINEQFAVNRTNWLYDFLKNAIDYNVPEIDLSNVSVNKHIKLLAKHNLYNPIKEVMIESIKKVEKNIGVTVDIKELGALLKKILTGTKMNVRKTELFIFPMFYNCLILLKQLTNKKGNTTTLNLSTKKILLWDIFLIILPEYPFKTKDEILTPSNNSNESRLYYEYQIDIMKTIIGS